MKFGHGVVVGVGEGQQGGSGSGPGAALRWSVGGGCRPLLYVSVAIGHYDKH